MKKWKISFGLIFLVVASLFISACTENIPGTVIPPRPESKTYFLTLKSNLTERVGDGVTYLYLDVPGSENRTYYDFIGDDNQ